MHNLAEVVGIEPTHPGIKTQSLSTWLYLYNLFGAPRGIRTPDFTALQAVALDRSATGALFGRPGGI